MARGVVKKGRGSLKKDVRKRERPLLISVTVTLGGLKLQGPQSYAVISHLWPIWKGEASYWACVHTRADRGGRKGGAWGSLCHKTRPRSRMEG
jgi:hypothetical protein